MSFLSFLGLLALQNATWLQYSNGVPDLPVTQRASIDAVLKEYEKPSEPGCSAGIYGNGKVLYAGAFGLADLRSKQPNTPQTSINVGSIGKQFTAAGIVLLAREGKLSLDDDIRKHIPELPDYGRPITIRRLLTHTSGVRDYRGLLNLAGHRNDEPVNAERILHLLALQRGLSFPTGEQVQYSNSGYFLAGLIIQRVSGLSFQTFMREQIFEPLGMTRTRFKGDTTNLPLLARHHTPFAPGEFRSLYEPWEDFGTGDLYSTVEDLGRWDAHLRSGQFDELFVRARLNDGQQAQYGLGLRFGANYGQPTVGHTGGSEGSVSSYQHFPQAGLSVVAMCNRTDGPADTLVSEISALVLPKSPAKGPPAILTEYVGKPNMAPETWLGSYFAIGNPSVATVHTEASQLKMHLGGGEFPLRPVGGDVYQVIGAPPDTYARFVPANQGQPRMLVPLGTDETPMFAFKPAEPGAAQLGAYAGVYRCSEVAATMRFRIENNQLLADIRPDSGQLMKPLGRHQFTFERLVFTFDEPIVGASPGLRIDQWRARGMRCRRATPGEDPRQ